MENAREKDKLHLAEYYAIMDAHPYQKELAMYPRNEKLGEYAKDLRKNMTQEEKHLWYDFLKSFQSE